MSRLVTGLLLVELQELDKKEVSTVTSLAQPDRNHLVRNGDYEDLVNLSPEAQKP